MTRGVPDPDHPRCGAPTSGGGTCQRPEAVRGGRCSHHAGSFRRAPRPDPRRPRINQRGEVWCHNCQRYLRADQFKWMTCPSIAKPRFWSYCYPCCRELDRLRWRGERRETNNQRRRVQQIRQQRQARQEKITFVRDAILILRRRGFTKSEVAKLAGVSWTTLLHWERADLNDRGPSPNAAHRLGVVLWETRDYALQEGPAYRRRLPHPDLVMLFARIEPQLAPYPLRSRWRSRLEVAA